LPGRHIFITALQMKPFSYLQTHDFRLSRYADAIRNCVPDLTRATRKHVGVAALLTRRKRSSLPPCPARPIAGPLHVALLLIIVIRRNAFVVSSGTLKTARSSLLEGSLTPKERGEQKALICRATLAACHCCLFGGACDNDWQITGSFGR
jgi:hypothetical protein